MYDRMPYKDPIRQKEAVAVCYQRKRLDAEWRAKSAEKCRQWKANNRDKIRLSNKVYAERKKLEKLMEDSETFYQTVKESIKCGKRPFDDMPEDRINLWWTILETKVRQQYDEQVGQRYRHSVYGA